jgi:4-amino-4-deoxy-L-arabinose transferase-like glycosyltransferase
MVMSTGEHSADVVAGVERHADSWTSQLRSRAAGWLTRTDRVLLVAICLGIAARAWSFGAIPPGLNQDEASMAYDAYSLARYGIDRNGFHFPVMTVSWGSGMYALASYLTLPFVGILGLSVVATRLPFLLVGVATIPLFYLLLDHSIDRRTARIGAVLLALSPWHIMASRWSLDCNLLPFVFLVATLLLLRSLQRPSLLVAACMTYAYATRTQVLSSSASSPSIVIGSACRTAAGPPGC